jgi:hypothetical protein
MNLFIIIKLDPFGIIVLFIGCQRQPIIKLEASLLDFIIDELVHYYKIGSLRDHCFIYRLSTTTYYKIEILFTKKDFQIVKRTVF